MSTETYNLDDTANAVLDMQALKKEINDNTTITTECLDVSAPNHEGDFNIEFEGDLGGGEKTELGSVVGAHPGTPLTTYQFIANTKLVEDEKTVTSDSSFEQVGGVVTKVDEFAATLSKVVGRVRGSAKVSGSGAQIQLVEEGSPDTVMHTSDWDLADTSGAWVEFEFVTDVTPSAGTQTFRLDGRLDGATSFELRFVSLTLLMAQP